jgi:hypothetical protein
MATGGRLFQRRLRLATSRGRVVLLLAVAAIASGSAAHASSGGPSAWPDGARAAARSVALRWAADIPDTARLGAEPPGRCRQLDGRHGTCSIAIAILAHDASGRRPWRCSATAVIAGAGDTLAARRTGTHCVPFPPPSTDPEPAGILGTAIALGANGEVACLGAGRTRVTCVMRYRPTAKRCVAAASVPLAHPERAVALGAPICR